MELNKIYNEDCYDTLKRIETSSIDLMITDPPYGILACEWDIMPNLNKMWIEWERILKPNGAWIFTSNQPFTTDLIISNRKFFKYELIWEKSKPTGFLNVSYMPNKIHENILIFYREKPTYNPQKYKVNNIYIDKRSSKALANSKNAEKTNTFNITGSKANNYIRKSDDGYRYPDSILCFNSLNVEKIKHPTAKSLDLFRYLIKTYSNEGDIIFDGYMGSATTAIACIEENRYFIGSELNKEYYDAAIKRINNHISQQKLF
jgi:DNA modification methylase